MTYTEHYALYKSYNESARAELRRSIELRSEAGSLRDVDGCESAAKWLALAGEADERYREYDRLSKLARKHWGIYQSVMSRKLNHK